MNWIVTNPDVMADREAPFTGLGVAPVIMRTIDDFPLASSPFERTMVTAI